MLRSDWENTIYPVVESGTADGEKNQCPILMSLSDCKLKHI